MAPVIFGSLIEAVGIIFFVIGVTNHGFPPPMPWLIPAIAFFVIGNGIIVLAILSKAMAAKKKQDMDRKE